MKLSMWNCLLVVCDVQKYVIVLEEEVIPSHDFLEFFAQCLTAVDSDETLVGISAWNINGLSCLLTCCTSTGTVDMKLFNDDCSLLSIWEVAI